MKASVRLLLILTLFVVGYRAVAQVPFVLSASLTNGASTRSVITADVNKDGKPDLIYARISSPSFVIVWTNSGNGLLVSNAGYIVGIAPDQVIAADVNNDGWPDLVTANNSGDSLTILTNNGRGGFLLAATLSTSPDEPSSVAAVDLFGRGRLDLVYANTKFATVGIWTNNGGGIFVSNASYSVGVGGHDFPQWVTTADVNGDGKPDIICGNGGGGGSINLAILTNNGAGGFVSAPAPAFTSGVSCVVAMDVNGDGKVDLACTIGASGTSAVSVSTNNGSGGFSVPRNYLVGVNPSALVAADVNGDGTVDLINCNAADNTLTLLTNNGSGIFGSNTTLTVGSQPTSVAAADMNGDGRMDLISGNSSAGTLTVLTNAATFLPRLTLKQSGNTVLVSWPAVWVNWTLEQSAGLNPAGWTSFSGPIGNDDTTKTATNTSPADTRFFRLSYP